MPKSVFTKGKITLGGVDVSDHVTRWSIDARVGDLYVCRLHLIGHKDIVSFPYRDVTLVKGQFGVTDVSAWIASYWTRHYPDERSDTLVLNVQCDRNVLCINGTYPWEPPEGSTEWSRGGPAGVTPSRAPGVGR